MDNKIFMLKSAVSWSFLTSGFNIKKEERSVFNSFMQEVLIRGFKKKVCVRIQGEDFQADLANINFNRQKWERHDDIIQIKYSVTQPIAQKLQSIFAVSYAYLKAKKAEQVNKRCHIPLPDTIPEFFVLRATNEPYVFELECFTVKDIPRFKVDMPLMNEEEYESLNNDDDFAKRLSHMIDAHASIEEREKLVKIRKIDRSIIDNLKWYYDNHCQITGEKVGENFGQCVIEAHHIDYFTESQNNDASNIIILSPNYHRIIHRNNPKFNHKTKCFEFPNGEKLGLKLNKHL